MAGAPLGRLGRNKQLRIKPQYVFVVIVLITLASTWVTLPKHVLNIAGAKDGIDVHKGLDLQGGLQVVLEARPTDGKSVGKDVINGTRNTIERRVNGLGVSEPLIQTRGNNQITSSCPASAIRRRQSRCCNRRRCWRSSTPMAPSCPSARRSIRRWARLTR